MRPVRRQLLADTVYVVFHDALKAWHNEGRTSLTPQEVCLSARNLCKVILSLPDAEEGIEDELDDLEDEASDETDAMLVEMVAASMLSALSSGQRKSAASAGQQAQSQKPVILCIMKRWCDHELFDNMLEEGCKKEEARYAAGKRSDLIHYELMEIEREGGDTEIKRQFVDECFIGPYGNDKEFAKNLVVCLARYSIEHGNCFSSQLNDLCSRLGGNQQGVSAGGDNKGIMAGGDIHADIKFTDQQVEMLTKEGCFAPQRYQPRLDGQ